MSRADLDAVAIAGADEVRGKARSDLWFRAVRCHVARRTHAGGHVTHVATAGLGDFEADAEHVDERLALALAFLRLGYAVGDRA